MVGMVSIGVGSSGALPLGSPLEGALKGSWGGVTTPLEAKGSRSRGDEAGNTPGPEALDTRELIERLRLRVREAGPSLATELAWERFRDDSLAGNMVESLAWV
jgi:hypothetical protein